MTNNPIRSVEKALSILEAFDSRTPELGVTELSSRTGFPKSVTHKLLRTLAIKGFVRQDHTSHRYRIGPAILAVAGALLNTDPLIREGTPVLQRLSRMTSHTATLGILDRSEVLFVAAVEGTHAIRAGVRVGDRRPLHATATGKVLLAGLNDTELNTLLGLGPLQQFTPTTVTDPEVLRRELQLVRRRGTAYNLGERVSEASAIAAPAFDYTNQVVAGMAVVFPANMGNRVFAEFARAVIACGQELSAHLGARQIGDENVMRSFRLKTGSHNVYVPKSRVIKRSATE